MSLVLRFPDIDPVAVNLFGLKIHWYALMYLISFAAGYLLLLKRLRHEPFRSVETPGPWGRSDIEDVIFYAIIGIIVGGRLGYCLIYKPTYFLQHPMEIIRIWDGGLSFHGGFIGVLSGLALYAWRKRRPFLQVGDFLAPAVPIGIALVRIGNFINGELWGREAPAGLPWAMVFPAADETPRHPSQVYQALLEGMLLFILLWLYARTPRRRGEVSGAFLAGYGVLRFIGEFWREPDAHLGLLGLGMSMGQWLSAPMVLAGIALWAWSRRRGIDDAVAQAADKHDDADVDEGETVGEAEAQECRAEHDV